MLKVSCFGTKNLLESVGWSYRIPHIFSWIAQESKKRMTNHLLLESAIERFFAGINDVPWLSFKPYHLLVKIDHFDSRNA